MGIRLKTPYEFVEEVAEIYGWTNFKDHLQVSKQSISNWKLGKREPSAEMVIKCVSLMLDGEKPFTMKTNKPLEAVVSDEFSMEEFV